MGIPKKQKYESRPVKEYHENKNKSCKEKHKNKLHNKKIIFQILFLFKTGFVPSKGHSKNSEKRGLKSKKNNL